MQPSDLTRVYMMLLTLLILTLFAVILTPVYINIESCNKSNMCVHNITKGYDELSREGLDTKYTYDCNDNCDYAEPNNSIQTEHDDLTILHLNIRGLYSKLGQMTYLIDHLLANCVPDVLHYVKHG